MKRRYNFIIFLCLMMLTAAQPAVSAERKGIQIIGLSKLSDASVQYCAAAIKESGTDTIEFAFMPFFNPEGPFNNVNTLLDIPNVSKVETIILSWRDEPVMNGSWADSLAELKSRAVKANAHIKAVRDKASKIILVPMLEDTWRRSAWLEAVHMIAGQLESGEKVHFRRSIDPSLSPVLPPSSIDTALKNGIPHTFLGTRLETHSMYHHRGPAQVISNDGGFVYQSAEIGGKHENKTSLPDAPGGSRNLSDWTRDADMTKKVSILWRPAYNLFKRWETDNLLNYEKPKDSAGRIITLDQRTDSDVSPSFNVFEKEVLKAFLRGTTMKSLNLYDPIQNPHPQHPLL